MIEPTIYISTCDKTKSVLSAAFWLLEKYWPKEKKVCVLGYNEEGIKLPNEHYSFISMKPVQESINNWAADLYSVISKDKNEFIIFFLDDMLMIDYFNLTLFNILFSKMEFNTDIVRADLGMDLQMMPFTKIYDWSNVEFIQKHYKAPYWHTTQPSIWRKDYFLSVLLKSTNPWDFETKHNTPIGKTEIGTKGKYVAKSMVETAVSKNHPDKFNILGIKFEDVKELISKGFITEDVLQFGIKPGLIPQFSKFGYDFTLDILGKQEYQSVQVKENLFTYYSKLYGSQY